METWMKADHIVLNDAEWYKAHEAVAQWKNTGSSPQVCPRCSEAQLTITDQSVRPYSEWYKLDCNNCGLDVTMHQPLSQPLIPSV